MRSGYITRHYIGHHLILKNTISIWLHFCNNKAIRDGRPRPPRRQVGWDIVTRECACQISWWSVEKWRRYYILKFRGNTFRWPMTLTFNFVSHGVPIRNMYAKFHNDRLRNGWDITLWNFAKTRTNTHTHTNKQMKGHSESAYFAKLDLQTEWFTLKIECDQGQGHNQLVLMTQMKSVQWVEYYLWSILVQYRKYVTLTFYSWPWPFSLTFDLDIWPWDWSIITLMLWRKHYKNVLFWRHVTQKRHLIC